MREADLVPLSALQHYLYCPRQCALIHVEQQWAENRFTAEGRVLHEKTHTPGAESRHGVKTVRSMPVRSFRVGVSGIADVVELHRNGGRVRPYPIEYKRGRPKAHRADEVQLCAQAMALEEMFETGVPDGALFYGKTRRRQDIAFDADLRALTTRIAHETRALILGGETPAPMYERKKCDACSLLALCQPKRLMRHTDIAQWISRHIESG